LIELAGEACAPVNVPDELPLDESWAEPAAFDGCSSAGQSRPGQPQPIHIQRKSPGTAATGARP
jgi:nitrate reductase delta subunit